MMASKRQRYEDEDGDSPARELGGIAAKEDKRRLPHTSARKKITAAMKAVARFDVTKHIDGIVEAMQAIATDVGRRRGESEMDYCERVRNTLGLIPYWSMDVTDFDAPHPYRGCSGLLYEHYDVVAAYKIPGDRWIDIYIGASACVLLSEGRVGDRFIEDLYRQGNWLYIGIGT